MDFLKSYVKSSESIIVFVILELLGLMCFGLGGSNIIFFVVGILVNVATIPFMVINSTKEELKHFGIFAIPLVLMAALISFGNMYRVSSLYLSNICSFLSIISFLMIGYNARRIKSFKIENALIVIGGAFALITAISMFITWYNYGLFYAAKYADTPIYYYNGFLFDVTKESSWLLGFSLSEVSLAYSGLFGFISALFLIGLLFIKPKEHKLTFLLYAVYGLIGLAALITVPNKRALLLLIPSFIVALCYRFIPKGKKTQKAVDVIFGIAVGFVCLGLFLAILNNYVPAFANIVKSNRYLNKALNGLYMDEVNEVLGVVFSKGYFFGVSPTLLNGSILTTNTRMFEAEIMKEGGFFALVFFMVFMVFSYLSIRAYNRNSKDSPLAKIMLISVIFGLFIYCSLNYDGFFVVHSSSTYYPFFRSLPALAVITLIGYTFYPFLKKDVKLYMDGEDFARGVTVEPKVSKKVKTDKDYQFDEEDDLDE